MDFVKTYAPYKKFRHSGLYWPNGIRMTSPAELKIIKGIPHEFPIRDAQQNVLNPPPSKVEEPTKKAAKPTKGKKESMPEEPTKEQQDENPSSDREDQAQV